MPRVLWIIGTSPPKAHQKGAQNDVNLAGLLICVVQSLCLVVVDTPCAVPADRSVLLEDICSADTHGDHEKGAENYQRSLACVGGSAKRGLVEYRKGWVEGLKVAVEEKVECFATWEVQETLRPQMADLTCHDIYSGA